MSCAFETSCTSELITIIVFIENICEVELAMNNMCSIEENLKAGLKLALGTLIKRCCAILIDHYATSGQRSVADQILEFMDVFSSPTHYAHFTIDQCRICGGTS